MGDWEPPQLLRHLPSDDQTGEREDQRRREAARERGIGGEMRKREGKTEERRGPAETKVRGRERK